MQIDYIETTTSTNDTVRAKNRNFHLVWSDEQTAGRGQRGNSWESEKGMNLTFSFMLHPTFLEAERQFIISKAIALSVCDTLGDHGIKASVKWPNDIYVGDKKICGILIECDVAGNGMLQRVIVGVGLNVNQTNFVSDAPNPISMLMLNDKQSFDRRKILDQICIHMENNYSIITEELFSVIDRRYWEKLYRRDKHYSFRDSNGLFEGKIKDITKYGALIIKHKDGKDTEYQFKEVEFVL